MESPHGLTAIFLCCSLCLPAPLSAAQQATDPSQPPANAKSRPNYAPSSESVQLRGDERILQALNRFTFGPKPGDLEAVRTMGLDNWFDQQLRPAAIDETDLTARLAQFPAMQWSMQDLFFRLPSNPIIRLAAQGRVDIPQVGTLQAVYENQIYRIQARKEAKAEKGTVAANQAPGLANGPVNQSMNAGMDGDANSSMAPNPQAANTQQATDPSAATQSATGPAGSSQPSDMNAMTPAASATNSDQPPALPPVDDATIRSILSLPSQQRVMRLQSMQPADFENFIKSLRPVQRQALMAGLSPDLERVRRSSRKSRADHGARSFLPSGSRATSTPTRSLQEVMTDFWLNHFNIYLRKNEQMPYYLVSYERDVIRPRALGKFEDLLEAVAHSPAMMLYLDNAESMGPDSPAAERAKMERRGVPTPKRKPTQGLNENYARELMELHTLGVNGGYTQADVTQVARVLTGWTVDRPQRGGGLHFNAERHEPGTKKVLGAKDQRERRDGRPRAAAHAGHRGRPRRSSSRASSPSASSATIRRRRWWIAWPSRISSSGGDIPTVLKTLFHSPEFWAASDYRAKVKTPLEFVVCAVRASNADIENFQPLVNALRQMGMPLYGCVPPTGYKWDASDWVSTGALVDRMNFALSLAANRLPGITVEWAAGDGYEHARQRCAFASR